MWKKQIRNKLSKFPIPDREQELYCMDQRINDRASWWIRNLSHMQWPVTFCIRKRQQRRHMKYQDLRIRTAWHSLRDGLHEKASRLIPFAKAAVEELVENTDGDVAEMMKLRLALSKTSVKKYEAMERSVCPDGRVHGLLQFTGPTVQEGGPADWCRSITFPRTIWKTSNLHAPS